MVGWFVIYQSIYWSEKTCLPVLLDNGNLKTISSFKAQLALGHGWRNLFQSRGAQVHVKKLLYRKMFGLN